MSDRPEKFLTRKEAAARVPCNVKSIDRAIRRKLLKASRNGLRMVRIAESEFNRWMNGGDSAKA